MTASFPELLEREGWQLRLAKALDLPAGLRQELIARVLAAARGEGGEPIRRSRHAVTYLGRLGGHNQDRVELYIKLFEQPHGLEAFKEFFRGSRAAHVAAMTKALGRVGFGCAPLLVFGGSRDGRSLVVSARAEGTPLPEVLAACAGEGLARKRKLLAALGAEVGRLHRAGFIHGDLTPHNVFVTRCDPPAFVFIDHDRTRRAALVGRQRRRLRNLVQLGRFELSGLTRTGRLRFFRAWARALGLKDESATGRRLLKMIAKRLEKDRAAASGPDVLGEPRACNPGAC